MGQLTRDLRDIGARSDSASLEWLTWIAHRVLPDLEGFNLAAEAAHLLPVSASDVLLPLAYGAGYITVLMLFAVGVFQRRDFR